MDTNLVALLIKSLVDQTARNATTSSPGAPHDYTSLLIAGMFLLAAIAPTLATYIQIVRTKEIKQVAEDTNKSAKDNTAQLKEVHLAVNSERSALLAVVQGLREDILKLSQEKATMVEQIRGQGAASALLAQTSITAAAPQTTASSISVPATVPVTAVISEAQLAQLDQLITALRSGKPAA